MELFSLVLINLLCLGVTYVFISAKVQKAVSEYYDKKLNRAIEMATSETMNELDRTVSIIESRLSALRTMIEKAELLAKEFKHYQKNDQFEQPNTKQRIDEVPPYYEMGLSMESELSNIESKLEQKTEVLEVPSSLLKEQRSGIAQAYQANQHIISESDIQTTDGAVNQVFSKIGRAVKGMMGMEENQTPTDEAKSNVVLPQYRPKTDYTVGGNPFSEEKSKSVIIRDQNKEGILQKEFLTSLSAASDPAFAMYQNNFEDQIDLSMQSVMLELPSSASKIDKVVFLLKKGYSHDQISDFMNIGIHEIHLIETIRLDRTRRI
ncbi:MAG: hypothetical protein SH817_15645 [Leptospira sp.]|nr:hypothetical protein [Leptospira sp.]